MELSEIKDKMHKDNIPCAEFKEAQSKGILQKHRAFVLNGIEYYTFEKELQMICANRYLLYMQDLQSFQAFGMTMEVSKDYVAEMLEYQDKLDTAISNGDLDMARKHMDDLKLTSLVYKEHQNNFNIISAILDLNAISFIAPCENPYVVDYDYMNKKIMDWSRALSAEEGAEFLTFFWKLSSRGDQSWMSSLMQSIRHQGKELSQMSESEIRERRLSENILTLDILRAKKRLEDLIAGKSSLSRVRQSRIMSNFLKWKHRDLLSLNIFNINS